MSLLCKLGLHKWEGCKCSLCGKSRDERHDWAKNCEKCSKCEKARTNQHVWEGCKCSLCGKSRDEGHDWAKNCEKCAKCEKARTAQHTWDGCKCSTCGSTRLEGHRWDNEKCSVCGQTADVALYSACILPLMALDAEIELKKDNPMLDIRLSCKDLPPRKDQIKLTLAAYEKAQAKFFEDAVSVLEPLAAKYGTTVKALWPCALLIAQPRTSAIHELKREY